MKRKSLSEKDIRTIIAVFESIQEDNQYDWSKMNRFIGSMTLDEMLDLNQRLKKWAYPEKFYDDPEDEMWQYDEVVAEYSDTDLDEYRDSYNDYISSYIY